MSHQPHYPYPSFSYPTFYPWPLYTTYFPSAYPDPSAQTYHGTDLPSSGSDLGQNYSHTAPLTTPEPGVEEGVSVDSASLSTPTSTSSRSPTRKSGKYIPPRSGSGTSFVVGPPSALRTVAHTQVCMRPYHCGGCDTKSCALYHDTVPEAGCSFSEATPSQFHAVSQLWQDSGGQGTIKHCFRIHNRRLQRAYEATEFNLDLETGSSDEVCAWHGTREEVLTSIAHEGFNPLYRERQVYGDGEYFARDPEVAKYYCDGGKALLLCSILLGEEGRHHRWVKEHRYYVSIQEGGAVLALPLFVVFFGDPKPETRSAMDCVSWRKTPQGQSLITQTGATTPAEGRRARSWNGVSCYLWLGWLDPELRSQPDEHVAAVVREFLRGHTVLEVLPERNGLRVGAFVRLRDPIDAQKHEVLARRLYRGKRISIDNEMCPNPLKGCLPCPRLNGEGGYCRGWNIRGHCNWRWRCAYNHNGMPTQSASFVLRDVSEAKREDITTRFLQSTPFGDKLPKVARVCRVENQKLIELYRRRRLYVQEKQGFVLERELWHGTNMGAIHELLTHGLQPPADSAPGAECPRSGGRGLSTTLCGTDCAHCVDEHSWNKCHMYGLGVYLADQARKSHQYVRGAQEDDQFPGHERYCMLLCKVNLGSPYLIEGELRERDSMHHLCWCSNPTDLLQAPHPWDIAWGHDSFYIKGTRGHKRGLGVLNNEYVLFHPWHILPLYLVEYLIPKD